MDHRDAPESMVDSDDEDDDVQTVQSKWLNDDGMHEMKNSHNGIYSPKGLANELNKKPRAVFLQYFVAKIVTVKDHAGFGACGLHCKAPGCSSILKPNNINQSVAQHGKKCQCWLKAKEKTTPGEEVTLFMMSWTMIRSMLLFIRREEESGGG